jgi:ATP-binding cassette, subfamily F, member 3
MNQIVSWENLVIGYQGLELAKIPDQSFCEGKVLWIEGSNGCGKTTLVKTLLGELPVVSGKILRQFEHQNVAYLAQLDHMETHMPITVAELLGREHVNLDNTELLSGISPWLLWHHASGGQKRRILLQLELLSEKSLFVLDEPFNHLDGFSAKLLDQVLYEAVCSKKIKGIILISHQKNSLRINQLESVKINL